MKSALFCALLLVLGNAYAGEPYVHQADKQGHAAAGAAIGGLGTLLAWEQPHPELWGRGAALVAAVRSSE